MFHEQMNILCGTILRLNTQMREIYTKEMVADNANGIRERKRVLVLVNFLALLCSVQIKVTQQATSCTVYKITKKGQCLL